MSVTREDGDTTRSGIKQWTIKAATERQHQIRNFQSTEGKHSTLQIQQQFGTMKNLYLALLLALCLTVLVARAQDATDDVSETVFAPAV